MNEFLNKKITIAQVIEFLERCFIHTAVNDKCTDNVVDYSLSNFQFLDINMDIEDVNLDFQDITLDFADINFEPIAA